MTFKPTRPAWQQAAAALAVLLAWWTLLVLGAPLVRVSASVLVLGPSAPVLKAVSADVAVRSASTWHVVLSSASAQAVREAYGHGAWLVLPIGRGGCGGGA